MRTYLVCWFQIISLSFNFFIRQYVLWFVYLIYGRILYPKEYEYYTIQFGGSIWILFIEKRTWKQTTVPYRTVWTEPKFSKNIYEVKVHFMAYVREYNFMSDLFFRTYMRTNARRQIDGSISTIRSYPDSNRNGSTEKNQKISLRSPVEGH